MITGEHRGPLSDDDVAAAYPWPADRPWVRAMMVTTLDGAAAGADGLSGSVSSDADRAVFLAVRRFADVVLVGAGTVRDEEYGPLKARPEDEAARREQGSAAAPVLAIVSGSLGLPWDAEVFTDSTERVLVITSGTPDPERLAAARKACDVVVLPGDTIDAEALLAVLVERGLPRVVCEGGPTLLRSVTAAGLLDEADITISPMLAGTDHTPRTPMLEPAQRFDLAHSIENDGFLMNRYVVRATA